MDLVEKSLVFPHYNLDTIMGKFDSSRGPIHMEVFFGFKELIKLRF